MAETVMANPAKRWAREYEVIYILRPDVAPEDAEKIAGRVQEVMTRLNGKLIKVDVWGKRKLAYTIKKYSRGIFTYLRFVAYGELIVELERNLRLLEPVMAFSNHPPSRANRLG